MLKVSFPTRPNCKYTVSGSFARPKNTPQPGGGRREGAARATRELVVQAKGASAQPRDRSFRIVAAQSVSKSC